MGVTGIGGFFFRARDPENMTRWYRRHLGVGAAAIPAIGYGKLPPARSSLPRSR